MNEKLTQHRISIRPCIWNMIVKKKGVIYHPAIYYNISCSGLFLLERGPFEIPVNPNFSEKWVYSSPIQKK